MLGWSLHILRDQLRLVMSEPVSCWRHDAGRTADYLTVAAVVDPMVCELASGRYHWHTVSTGSSTPAPTPTTTAPTPVTTTKAPTPIRTPAQAVAGPRGKTGPRGPKGATG